MRTVIVVAAVVAGLVSPASALGDGAPVIPMQGGAGAGVPTRPERYVAVGVHGNTLVERVVHGQVRFSRLFPGRLGVPGAAFDGSATGLSADGRKLVLAAVPRRYPQRSTELVVLDAPALRIDERIELRGFYTVDAVSPYGDRIYLVHYKDASGLRYEVLSYDIRHRRLSTKPIVDPREPDEKMLGLPVTRAVSHDGRWAYTLYQRNDDAPFIHALDTRRGRAACIDLDALARVDPSTLRLKVPSGGGPLRVVSAAGTQALVNRRTFEVLRPIPAAAPAKPRPARAESGGPPWAAAAGALAAVLALAGIAAARRRRYDRSASLRNAS